MAVAVPLRRADSSAGRASKIEEYVLRDALHLILCSVGDVVAGLIAPDRTDSDLEESLASIEDVASDLCGTLLAELWPTDDDVADVVGSEFNEANRRASALTAAFLAKITTDQAQEHFRREAARCAVLAARKTLAE